MDVSLDYYYKIVRITLTLIGCWPYQSRKNIFFRRVLIMTILCLICVTQAAAFFTSHFHSNIIIEMTVIHAVSLSITLSLIFHYSNETVNKELWDEIHMDWLSVESEAEIEMKKSFANTSRKILIIICWLFVTLLPFFVLLSLVSVKILDVIIPLNESRPNHFPFTVEYFYDQEQHFYVTLFLMLIATTVIAFLAALMQTVYWIHILYLLGMLHLIGRQLDVILLNKNDTDEIEEIFYCSVVTCIRRHQKALKLRLLLQSYWGVPMSFFMVLFMLGVILALIQLSVNPFDCKLLYELGFAFSTIFVNCSLLQRVTDDALEIMNKVYSIEWDKIKPSSRKLLPLIIFQAHQPFTLKGLKIVAGSLTNLREIIRLTISYYTVINEIR